MTVAHILSVKGRDVVTTTPDSTLFDLVRQVSDKGIGAVLVTNSAQEIVGIISERDVMRAIARHGMSTLEERVSSHMTHTVETAREEEQVLSVMQRMTKGRFRHMPVVKDGKIAGIISIGDLIKHRLGEMEAEQQALKEYIGAA